MPSFRRQHKGQPAGERGVNHDVSNPTSKVASTQVFYDDVKGLWPLVGGASKARSYQNGQMMGVRADGYASDMDDSAPLRFLGLCDDPAAMVKVAAEDGNGDRRLRYARPYRFSMPLSSGTISRVTDMGKPVYAVDGAHVTLDKSSLTYQNLVGYAVGVYGTLSPDGLTGTDVWIEPAPWNGMFLPIPVPITSGRNGDYTVLNATGSSSTFKLAGTVGTSTCLETPAVQNTSDTCVALYEVKLPDNYIAGSNLTLTVSVQRNVAAGTTLTTSIDAEVFPLARDGSAAADICATAAQSFTNTAAADKNFTLTGTSLVPGQRLLIRLSGVAGEGGNAGTVQTQVNSLQLA